MTLRPSLVSLAVCVLLLELATEAVATNPNPALEAIARERGWRILRLFD